MTMPVIIFGAGEPVKRGLSSGSPQGAAGLRHLNSSGPVTVARNLLNLGCFQLLHETVSNISKAFHQFNSSVAVDENQSSDGAFVNVRKEAGEIRNV